MLQIQTKTYAYDFIKKRCRGGFSQLYTKRFDNNDFFDGNELQYYMLSHKLFINCNKILQKQPLNKIKTLKCVEILDFLDRKISFDENISFEFDYDKFHNASCKGYETQDSFIYVPQNVNNLVQNIFNNEMKNSPFMGTTVSKMYIHFKIKNINTFYVKFGVFGSSFRLIFIINDHELINELKYVNAEKLKHMLLKCNRPLENELRGQLCEFVNNIKPDSTFEKNNDNNVILKNQYKSLHVEDINANYSYYLGEGEVVEYPVLHFVISNHELHHHIIPLLEVGADPNKWIQIDSLLTYKNALLYYLEHVSNLKYVPNQDFYYDEEYVIKYKNQINLEIIKSFINYGVNINELNFQEGNVLHYLSNDTEIEVAKYLIECGANVNQKNELGHTPVMNVEINGVGNKENLLNYLKSME